MVPDALFHVLIGNVQATDSSMIYIFIYSVLPIVSLAITVLLSSAFSVL